MTTNMIGQWVELTDYGTARVVTVWRDGSFVARLADGSELSGLTTEHIRHAAAADILSRIESL